MYYSVIPNLTRERLACWGRLGIFLRAREGLKRVLEKEGLECWECLSQRTITVTTMELDLSLLHHNFNHHCKNNPIFNQQQYNVKDASSQSWIFMQNSSQTKGPSPKTGSELTLLLTQDICSFLFSHIFSLKAICVFRFSHINIQNHTKTCTF